MDRDESLAAGLVTAVAPATVTIHHAGFLVVLEAPAQADIGRIISVSATATIGRSSVADVVLSDAALSRCHVEIARLGDAYQIRDLESRNGTRVNGAPIDAIELRPGDQIQVGSTVLQFHSGSQRETDAWVRKMLGVNGVALWEYVAETDGLTFSEHIDRTLDLPMSTFGRRCLPLATCVHAADLDRVRAALRAARDGAPLDLEVRLHSASIERWVALRGHQTGGAPNEPIIAGTIVNITAQKLREATLARAAIMFGSFADGVVLTDSANQVVDLNASMARIVGCGKAQIVGQQLFEIVPINESSPVGEVTAAIAQNGKWAATVSIGKDLFLDVQAFPLRTDSGEDVGMTWVFRDVTEKKRMSDQIVLLDRLAALGTMAAAVAHEINNPLTFVLNNTEFVRGNLAPSEHAPLIEALDEVRDGAHRIASVVRDLKVFSRSENTARSKPVDVRDTVEQALKMTARAVKSCGRIITSLDSVSAVDAVETHLLQVLVNLLINAAHAVQSGPSGENTITIRVTAGERNGVVIEVIDTGRGMSPDVAARVFEPFFTTKSMTEGTGLGLSICHALVTGMGGTITLESELGRGTTARVWLPASSAPPAATVPALDEPESVRARVLVVDDEPLLLRAFARILTEHEVVTAGGYLDAANRLLERREMFDVVVCDLMMPDGTGMDLYGRLVAERPDLAPHVVFMTGGVFTDAQKEFLETTTNLCLTKPVPRDRLRKMVLESCRRARGDHPARAIQVAT